MALHEYVTIPNLEGLSETEFENIIKQIGECETLNFGFIEEGDVGEEDIGLDTLSEDKLKRIAEAIANSTNLNSINFNVQSLGPYSAILFNAIQNNAHINRLRIPDLYLTKPEFCKILSEYIIQNPRFKSLEVFPWYGTKLNAELIKGILKNINQKSSLTDLYLYSLPFMQAYLRNSNLFTQNLAINLSTILDAKEWPLLYSLLQESSNLEYLELYVSEMETQENPLNKKSILESLLWSITNNTSIQTLFLSTDHDTDTLSEAAFEMILKACREHVIILEVDNPNLFTVERQKQIKDLNDRNKRLQPEYKKLQNAVLIEKMLAEQGLSALGIHTVIPIITDYVGPKVLQDWIEMRKFGRISNENGEALLNAFLQLEDMKKAFEKIGVLSIAPSKTMAATKTTVPTKTLSPTKTLVPPYAASSSSSSSYKGQGKVSSLVKGFEDKLAKEKDEAAKSQKAVPPKGRKP